MYLLDTDTVIYSLNGDAAVVQNLARHRLDPLRISAVTLLELYYGAYKSEQKTANLAKVRRIADAFDVIAVDGTVAETFGMLKTQLETAAPPFGRLRPGHRRLRPFIQPEAGHQQRKAFP